MIRQVLILSFAWFVVGVVGCKQEQQRPAVLLSSTSEHQEYSFCGVTLVVNLRDEDLKDAPLVQTTRDGLVIYVSLEDMKSRLGQLGELSIQPICADSGGIWAQGSVDSKQWDRTIDRPELGLVEHHAGTQHIVFTPTDRAYVKPGGEEFNIYCHWIKDKRPTRCSVMYKAAPHLFINYTFGPGTGLKEWREIDRLVRNLILIRG